MNAVVNSIHNKILRIGYVNPDDFRYKKICLSNRMINSNFNNELLSIIEKRI